MSHTTLGIYYDTVGNCNEWIMHSNNNVHNTVDENSKYINLCYEVVAEFISEQE